MSSDDLRNESKVTSFLSRKKDRKKAATKITSKMEQANVIVTIHLKRFIHPQQGVDFPQRRLLTPFLANVTLELLAHLRGKYRKPFIVAAAVQPAVRRIAVVVCSRPSIRQTELEKTLWLDHRFDDPSGGGKLHWRRSKGPTSPQILLRGSAVETVDGCLDICPVNWQRTERKRLRPPRAVTKPRYSFTSDESSVSYQEFTACVLTFSALIRLIHEIKNRKKEVFVDDMSSISTAFNRTVCVYHQGVLIEI